MKVIAVSVALCFAVVSRAEDWPQWRGLRRDGVWRETGILNHFRWRVEDSLACSCRRWFFVPSSRKRRVYVTDLEVTRTNAP
jgi:hypothetical protein